ncbi:hypothetical protein H6F95_07195 [Cyanobacteria bacterium FACHB-471]|nr:hypothetical protein [Cyanobacteria bacterium FACHB-471]
MGDRLTRFLNLKTELQPSLLNHKNAPKKLWRRVGSRMLQAWGEAPIKQFVHEAVEEALRLESALAKLDTSQRVAVLHYSPIQETVEGEPCDILPFLGSSRLEEPLNRFSVAFALHGHAHHGQVEGRTSSNIPVYNVSMPLLKKHFPDQPPFRLLEVPV